MFGQIHLKSALRFKLQKRANINILLKLFCKEKHFKYLIYNFNQNFILIKLKYT